MTPASASFGMADQASMRSFWRALLLCWAVGGLAFVLFGWWWQRVDLALAAVVGMGISAGSLASLAWMWRWLLGRGEARRLGVALHAFKMLPLGALLWLSLGFWRLHPLGLVCGLSLLPLAVFAVGLWRQIRWRQARARDKVMLSLMGKDEPSSEADPGDEKPKNPTENPRRSMTEMRSR